jgi:NTP pyrophosphatase (non-canonical NTP hydrolase)
MTAMNEAPHPLCVLLTNEVRTGISPVQHAFDAYQRECFIERPGEFFSLELCGEAGELANLEKKRWKGADIPSERLADEAADVLIALMNYANARNIDLAAAVCSKLSRIAPTRI